MTMYFMPAGFFPYDGLATWGFGRFNHPFRGVFARGGSKQTGTLLRLSCFGRQHGTLGPLDPYQERQHYNRAAGVVHHHKAPQDSPLAPTLVDGKVRWDNVEQDELMVPQVPEYRGMRSQILCL